MQNVRIVGGTRFRADGHDYVVEVVDADGGGRVIELDTGNARILTAAQLVAALRVGTISIEGESLVRVDVKAGLCLGDLDADDPTRLETLRRLAYVRHVLNLPGVRLSRSALAKAAFEVAGSIADRKPPSPKTLHRWVQDYENAGRQVQALVPATMRRGNRRPKIGGSGGSSLNAGPEKATAVSRIIDTVLRARYLAPGRPSAASVIRNIEDALAKENELRGPGDKLPVPHASTVYRKIKALDPFDVASARHGRRYANEKYHAVRQGHVATRPLERAELDHTKMDLMVVDTETRLPLGRPWLTSMIDRYSRMVLGFHLTFLPPGYLSVMQCLKHAIRTKDYLRSRFPAVEHAWPTSGVPETLVVDNGKEFRSRHFEDACLELGIEIDFAPPRCGAYKGTVERWFGTENTKLLHQLPGTTFSSILARGEYDPARNAVITLDALLELVHVFIVDIYGQQEHRGLHDIPARRWDEGVSATPPRIPESTRSLDVLLGCVAERSIRRSGIELFTLRYNCPELALVRRALGPKGRVRLKYDPSDLSMIHVLDPKAGRYLAVPSLDTQYTTGLSLWQHDVIRRYARREAAGRADPAALRRARLAVEDIVSRERTVQSSVRRRQMAVRYLGLSQPDYSPHVESLEGSGDAIGAIEPASSPSKQSDDVWVERADEAGWSSSYALPMRQRLR